MTELTAIAAVAGDGTIGDGGSIPWHYPEDLERFRELTMGSPVVMGRVTYDSIVERNGKPLDGRWSVVLSRTRRLPEWEDTYFARSIDKALEIANPLAERNGSDAVYVIGGAEVYSQLLPECDRVVLTNVPGEPGGNATFPALPLLDWRPVDAGKPFGADSPLSASEFERRKGDGA